MQLPVQSLTGKLNSAGNWEIDYQGQGGDAIVINRITITGPIGSTLNLYVDNTLIDATLRGDLNSNELLIPHILYSGQMLRLVWSLGNGNPSTATIFSSTLDRR